eukprot:305597_1
MLSSSKLMITIITLVTLTTIIQNVSCNECNQCKCEKVEFFRTDVETVFNEANNECQKNNTQFELATVCDDAQFKSIIKASQDQNWNAYEYYWVKLTWQTDVWRWGEDQYGVEFNQTWDNPQYPMMRPQQFPDECAAGFVPITKRFSVTRGCDNNYPVACEKKKFVSMSMLRMA